MIKVIVFAELAVLIGSMLAIIIEAWRQDE